MMRPTHCRSFRTLLMAASKCAPLRPPSAAPAPLILLPGRLPDPYTLRPDCKILHFRLKCSRLFSHRTPTLVAPNANAADGSRDAEASVAKRIESLRSQLEELGIDCRDLTPGVNRRGVCPKCNGGSTRQRCFSFMIRNDGSSAVWHCFRTSCAWGGILPVRREAKPDYVQTNQAVKTEENTE